VTAKDEEVLEKSILCEGESVLIERIQRNLEDKGVLSQNNFPSLYVFFFDYYEDTWGKLVQ
jgi:hypothetical protein